MTKKKRSDLALTVAAIQQKWGLKALRQLDQTEVNAKIPHIPTGFTALDKALGIGGIPRSRMSELLGVPTSGMTTLALKIMASAQAQGDTAAYLDLSRTFDADYAHRCEVDLSRLLLVRPHNGQEALAITQDLVASRGAGLLIFDAASDLLADAQGRRLMSTRLRQLTALLAKSPCAVVFLTFIEAQPPLTDESYALAHYATLRLFIEKERWITKRRDVRGYRAQVVVAKNKLGAGGATSHHCHHFQRHSSGGWHMIACLSLPYFSISLEQKTNPSLQKQPLIITEPGQRYQVFAACKLAAQVGVKPGMALRQAQLLCPEACTIPANHPYYRTILDQLLAVFANFTEWSEVGPAQQAVTGWLDLGPLVKAELAKATRQLGQAVRTSIGVSSSLGLAGGKFPAQVAAMSTAPNKARVIASGGEAVFLARSRS